jgi:conjugal transfer ATP-binding protein TraC
MKKIALLRPFEGELVEDKHLSTDFFPVLMYDGGSTEKGKQADMPAFYLVGSEMGVVFKCTVLSAPDAESTMEATMALIEKDMPAGSSITFTLYRNAISEEGLSVDSESIAHNLRNARLKSVVSPETNEPIATALKFIVAVKAPHAGNRPKKSEIERCKGLFAGVRSQFETMGLGPQDLNASEYITVCKELLLGRKQTPARHDVTQPISDQIMGNEMQPVSHHTHIEIKDDDKSRHIAVLSLKVSSDNLAFGSIKSFISGGIRAAQSVGASMTYSTSVLYLGRSQKSEDKAPDRAVAHLNQDVGETQSKSNIQVGISMAVTAESRDVMKQAVRKVQAQYRYLNANVFPEPALKLSLFLAMLPLCGDYRALYGLKRTKNYASAQAATVLPLFGDWAGDPAGALPLRTRAGDMVQLDAYHSGNHFIVAGQSKQWRSHFLVNQMETDCANGRRIIVVDSGSRYRPFSKVHGCHLHIPGQKKTGGINPFIKVLPWEEEGRVLTTLFQLMATSVDAISDDNEALLSDVVKTVREDRGPKMQVRDVIQALRQREGDEAQELAQRLEPFAADSPLGHALREKPAFTLDQSTIVDLGDIANTPGERFVLDYAAVHASINCLSDTESTKSTLYIPDFHVWPALPEQAIEAMYNSSNSKNLSVAACLGSYASLFELQGGPAILRNTSSAILLPQSPQVLATLDDRARFAMGRATIAELNKLTETANGYADLLILRQQKACGARLYYTPEAEMVYGDNELHVSTSTVDYESKDTFQRIVAMLKRRLGQKGLKGASQAAIKETAA